MSITVDFYEAVDEGKAKVGTVRHEDGKSFVSPPGSPVKNLLTQDIAVKGDVYSFKKDPEGWLRAAPLQFRSLYLWAVLREEED